MHHMPDCSSLLMKPPKPPEVGRMASQWFASTNLDLFASQQRYSIPVRLVLRHLYTAEPVCNPKKASPNELHRSFYCLLGMCAGSFATFMTHPFDMVKVSLMFFFPLFPITGALANRQACRFVLSPSSTHSAALYSQYGRYNLCTLHIQCCIYLRSL